MYFVNTVKFKLLKKNITKKKTLKETLKGQGLRSITNQYKSKNIN